MKTNNNARVFRLVALLLMMPFLVPALSAERLTYIHTDALGSPIAATDTSGNLLWREKYLPYGEKTLNQGNSTNLWYTGHFRDIETALIYTGARYYDPMIGRFMGVDSIPFNEENAHSFNRYAYANNNPYRFRDPNGLWAEEVVGAVSLTLSINAFTKDPTPFNAGVLALDIVLVAIPGVPAFAGATVHGAAPALSFAGKGARGGGDYITLFHGSIDDASAIRSAGLDPKRTPTWITTSLEAALNAIGAQRLVRQGQGLDRGIIESRIPRAEFERLQREGQISVERTWPGFNTNQTFPEHVLRGPDAIKAFNDGIVR
jgi:RHS repeat-associated protein